MPLTVAQLIDQLQQLDPDLVVYHQNGWTDSYSAEYETIDGATEQTISERDFNKSYRDPNAYRQFKAAMLW